MTMRLLLIGLLITTMVGCDSKKQEQARSTESEAKEASAKAEQTDEPDISREELSWIPAQPDDMEPIRVQHVSTAGQAARGASQEEALVTVVEIGDYGCPDTEARRELVDALLDEHGDEVRYVYRNVVWVPGEYGPFAANLAAAGAKSDQYWKAHEIIWQRFRKLDEYQKKSYLEPLDLTLKDLRRAENFAKERTDENQKLAKELNVQWVPTFFVNGVPMVKVGDDEFMRFVDVQLHKARLMQEKRGLEGEELYRAMATANAEHQEMAREGEE